jgi:hypothetical protein
MLNIIRYCLVAIFTGVSAVAGRAHGAATRDDNGKATGWPTWGKLAAKIYISALFGFANFYMFGLDWLAMAGAVITVSFLGLGHGRVYAMKGANLSDPKPEKLERWFGWLYRGDITKPGYSWYIMGLKGFFVGLPIFPFNLPLAALWPAVYAWAFQHYKDSAPAEWLSCGFAGLLASVVVVFYIL